MANVAVDQLIENQCNFILNDGKKQVYSPETNQEQFREQNKGLYTGPDSDLNYPLG